MGNQTYYNFPNQSIPETKKTEEWHMDHCRGHISFQGSSSYTNRKEEIESLYRAYLCMMNDEEKELMNPVTKPYGTNLGVDYIIYNLIEQKTEQLLGDYMERNLKRKSYVLNKNAQNRKLKAKIDTLSESFFRQMNEEFEAEYGIALDTENPQIEIPEDIEEFFEKTYKDNAEEVYDDLMEKFLDVDKQSREIIPTLRDFLIADQAHLEIYEENGIVKWQKVLGLDLDTDKDPAKIIQDDHEYYIKTRYLTENEIINTYELDNEQRERLKEDFGLLSTASGNIASGGQTWINDRGWFIEDNKSFRLAVVTMTWKSRKPLSVKVSKHTKTGEDIYKKMNEGDKVKKGDKILDESLETERHCVALGHNICLSYGISEFRNYRIGNPKKIHLNFVSIYRQNSLGVDGLRSVAAKLKKLQDWASEQLFELRLATRRNQGKVMIYDTAQIPKQYLQGNSKSAYGNALNRVMHHVKKDQMIFMNSKEKNNRYNYNQFTSVDLSTTGLINDIIAGMALIENLADKIIGFTPGRQGQAGQHTTATNVESQRQASFSRTEIYYRPFDDFLQTAMERVSMLSKHVYKEGDTIHYVIGDMKTKFLKITNEFSDSDIGWYLSDSSEDQRKKQIVDQAAQLALGNAQTEEMILSLIDVLSADTAVESKGILERAVAAGKKIREESQAAEQKQFEAKLNQDAEIQKEATRLSERAQDKDVVVANIYANQKKDQIDSQIKSKAITDLAKFEQDMINKFQESNNN